MNLLNNNKMKYEKILIGILLILTTISCNNGDEMLVPYGELSGVIQKGPFLNGSAITVTEYSNNLLQTGKKYSSQIIDNTGTFEIRNVEFASSIVELRADGFYFNEVSNTNSDAQLTLYALSDLSDGTIVNVNLLSTLEKIRVEYLTSKGTEFHDAKAQAQKEILRIFEIEKPEILFSENLDISQTGDDNAILLAISVILQGYLNVADLSELVANIGTDIRKDGVLNSQTLGSTLINNATLLRLDKIRENIVNRYEKLGISITVPDFEKYVKGFIDKTEFVVTNLITYPLTYKSMLNMLNDSSFIVQTGINYAIAAYLPLGTSLKIVCQPSEGFDWAGAGFFVIESEGFNIENNYPENMILTATGNDQTVNLPSMWGSGETQQTSFDFLIYENNSATCTRIKTVKIF